MDHRIQLIAKINPALEDDPSGLISHSASSFQLNGQALPVDYTLGADLSVGEYQSLVSDMLYKEYLQKNMSTGLLLLGFQGTGKTRLQLGTDSYFRTLDHHSNLLTRLYDKMLLHLTRSHKNLRAKCTL